MQMSYQQYFEALPCFVTVQNRDLKLLEANQRFRQAFGDIDGRCCYQVYKGRSEPCEQCPVEQTFLDGQPHSSEERLTTLDGQELSVLVNTTPILDEDGKVSAVMEMSTDISQQDRLVSKLRDSQLRYRLLFEEVPCYISIQDRDLRIVEANRRFREAFGNPLGLKCHQVYKHRDSECVPCSVMKTFSDGEVHHSEEVVTAIDGEQINTLVYTAPIFDENREIARVMEMSANITPIRELQSQLESIGLLISSISHGIKGLLTGLDGGIYLVNSGFAKDNPQRVQQGWEMVQRNVERVRSMVLNILYYAKERSLSFEQVQAQDIANEVLGVMHSKAQEHKVQLESLVSDDLGGFKADPQALRALLVNLMENSIDACRVDKKKPEHRVSLAIRGTAAAIDIEIQDNGIGMDRETQDKAFSLFFSSKGSEGTGLGLFIANNIAKAHGSRISIDSELDRGTRFRMRLPRSINDQPTSPAADAA